MKTISRMLWLAGLAVIGGLGFLYSGLYPMGADEPHTRVVYWALETLRERSIARATADIQVPDLTDPRQLLAGAADYNDMCAGCHLKPGRDRSDLSQGLYPQPPDLTQAPAEHAHGEADRAAARQFWIIRHGIKASGMAAFGATHDDARIWAMVAFLQQLPSLSADEYQILSARTAPGAHDPASH